MRKSIFFALCFIVLSAASAWGQALPTASRAGDLQVGGGFSFANPDYSPHTFLGYSFYADFDFKTHWGVEADFHQVNEGNAGGPYEQMYERTYEIGGRYLYPIRQLSPYAKVLYGRGVYNFAINVPPDPPDTPHPNLAFNLLTIGAGIDYRLTRSINLRGDYERQFWLNFPPNGLTPAVVTVGAAYHFH